MQIAGGHHEKWDGSGYPRGLAGAAIPLAARLMAVADVFRCAHHAAPLQGPDAGGAGGRLDRGGTRRALRSGRGGGL